MPILQIETNKKLAKTLLGLFNSMSGIRNIKILEKIDLEQNNILKSKSKHNNKDNLKVTDDIFQNKQDVHSALNKILIQAEQLLTDEEISDTLNENDVLYNSDDIDNKNNDD